MASTTAKGRTGDDLQKLIVEAEIEFVDSSEKLKKFQCCSCEKLSIFHHIGECEHRPKFCKNCFNGPNPKDCPVCKHPLQEASNHPACFENQILQLKVCCQFKKNGCQEIQTLKNILDHQIKCGYANREKRQLKHQKSICTMQMADELAHVRKQIADLQKKVAENEKSSRARQLQEKQSNHIELLEGKLQRESSAKRDLEKKVLDQMNRKNEVFKQEMVRHLTDQLNQKLEKQLHENEKKIVNQLTTYTERKIKQECVRSVNGQLNQQIEKQIQESSRKSSGTGRTPKSDGQAKKTAPPDQTLAHLERRIQDCEKRLTEKMVKMADVQKRELSKTVSQLVSVKTEKQLHLLQERSSKTTEMAKNELVKQFRDQKYQELRKVTLQSSGSSLGRSLRKTNSLKTTTTEKEPIRQVLTAAKPIGAETKSEELPQRPAPQLNQETEILKQEVVKTICDRVDMRIEVLKGELMRWITDEATKPGQLQTVSLAGEMQQVTNDVLQQVRGELVKHLQDFQATNPVASDVVVEKVRDQVMQGTEERFRELEARISRSVDAISAARDQGSAPKSGPGGDDGILRDVFQAVAERMEQLSGELSRQLDEKAERQKQHLLQYFDENLNRLLDSEVSEPATVPNGGLATVPEGGPDKQSSQFLENRIENWTRQIEGQILTTRADILAQVGESAKKERADLLDHIRRRAADPAEGLPKRIAEQLDPRLTDLKRELVKYLDDRLNALLDSEVLDSTPTTGCKAAPVRPESDGGLRLEFERQIQSWATKITMELTEKGAELETRLARDNQDRDASLRQMLDDLCQERVGQLATRLTEDVALQKVDLFTYLNTQLNEHLDARASGPVAAESPTNADGPPSDVVGLEARLSERVDRVAADLRQELTDRIQVANEAMVSHLCPEAEVVKIISKHLIEQIQEVQDRLSSQVNEKLEAQRLELLSSLQGLPAAAEGSPPVDAACAPAADTVEDVRQTSEEGAAAVVSNALPPSVELKIDQVVRDIADQVNHQLERHIEAARVRIRGEIDDELDKLRKKSEEQALSFSATQAEIKKMSLKLQEDMQKSGRRHSSADKGPEDGAVTSYVWRITKFQKQLQDLKSKKVKKIESGQINVKGTPLKAKATLRLSNESHWISLLIGFNRGKGPDPDCEEAPFTYSHRRTFTLMDQSGSEMKRDRIIVREPGFLDEGTEKWMQRLYGPVYFVPVDLLENDSIYVQNNAVLIRIVFEPTYTLYRPLTNDNGVLFWKIENYRLQKQAEVDGLIECLYSDYFYTGPKGYRLQVRAYLNGDEHSRSEYFSVFLYFRRGPWDEFLPCTFPHHTTFTVLDQSGPPDQKKDFVKTMQSSAEDKIDSGYGIREFALQSEIENPIYLKNDTLYIKVVIATLREQLLPDETTNGFASLGPMP